MKVKRMRRYGKEEFARMGDAIYEGKVRPLVEEGNKGRIVAIDIESGDYKVASDTLSASQYLTTGIPTLRYGAFASDIMPCIGFPCAIE